MRWVRPILLACLLACATLFAIPSVQAETVPTYEFVLQVDSAKLTEGAGGSDDIDAAMPAAIAVATRRLEGLDPPAALTHEGKGRLVVRITHADAPRIVRDVFGIVGDLDFLLVDMDAAPKDVAEGIARPGSAIYPMENGGPPIAVRLDGGVSGERLVHVVASIDSDTGQSVIRLQFDQKGTEAFADFTGANVGLRIAIVLDGEVLTAPTIQEAIRSGDVQISGNFTHDDANQLAIALRSGALPTPFSLVAERIIAPSP